MTELGGLLPVRFRRQIADSGHSHRLYAPANWLEDLRYRLVRNS
jgi:hypothetical protein